MKTNQIITNWMSHGRHAAEWLWGRGNGVTNGNKRQPPNDGINSVTASLAPEISGKETKYPMVNVEEYFANLKQNPSRIFRFIAVLQGKTRSDPATVMFDCNKKLKCGMTLNSFDGHKYIIVERKLKKPIPPPT